MVALAMSLLLTVPAPTESSSAASLRGIRSLRVTLHIQGTNVPEQSLRTDIELRLRQSGLRLADDAEGQLQLVLQVAPGPSGYRVYYATLSFVERMVRISDYRASLPKPADESWIPAFEAASWSQAVLGFERPDLLPETMRARARDLADAFLNDYLAANPREK